MIPAPPKRWPVARQPKGREERARERKKRKALHGKWPTEYGGGRWRPPPVAPPGFSVSVFAISIPQLRTHAGAVARGRLTSHAHAPPTAARPGRPPPGAQDILNGCAQDTFDTTHHLSDDDAASYGYSLLDQHPLKLSGTPLCNVRVASQDFFNHTTGCTY